MTVPAPVRHWVAAQLDTDDLTITPFPAGLTLTVYRVTTGTGYACVLRSLPAADWADAALHIASERIGCRLLTGRLPVPEVLFADPDGTVAGAPSSLTTLLPGEVRLDPPDAGRLAAMAAVAVTVHRTSVRGERPRPFHLWHRTPVQVPEWTPDPAPWQWAIEHLEAGPPAGPYGLIHRDLHPGNLLWEGERLSGVIDWAMTSWGPADLDIAHCCTNLAVLGGVEVALAFRDAYRRAGGVLADDPYWEIADLVGFLPDPVGHLLGYLRARTDLDDATVRQRYQQWLEVVVSRAGG